MELAKDSIPLSLSFDDVLLEPGYSQVLPADVDLSTQLGPLSLKIPMLSAAMDTVTESETAIALSLMGGIGVLHKNMSVDDQTAQLRRVKNFQHAVIQEPLTVSPETTVGELRKIIEQSGIKGFPVVDKKGVVVGICTTRDIRHVDEDKIPVSKIMSADVKSLPEGASRKQAVEFFQRYKVEKLPLVDKQGRLKGLMTSRDLRQAQSHPLAIRDERGSLLVAAAIGVGDVEGLERAASLVDSGVDALVLDSAHGHSEGIIKTLKALRKKYPKQVLVAGNLATAQAALDLAAAGADVLKIGIGPGSICTTRMVSGVGVPQFSAIYEVSRALRKKFSNVGLIADGGIRYSGDITKALAAGAHAVMIGSLFAGTDESPGEIVLYGGRSYKLYRGMGSLSAMRKGSRDRYFQAKTLDNKKLVPEGVEARVPYRGSISQVVHQLMGGLRSGMGYVGAASLPELSSKARFQRMTSGGLRESHVHNVQITNEAPNYSSTGADEA